MKDCLLKPIYSRNIWISKWVQVLSLKCHECLLPIFCDWHLIDAMVWTTQTTRWKWTHLPDVLRDQRGRNIGQKNLIELTRWIDGDVTGFVRWLPMNEGSQEKEKEDCGKWESHRSVVWKSSLYLFLHTPIPPTLQGWISIKTVILGNAALSTFF